MHVFSGLFLVFWSERDLILFWQIHDEVALFLEEIDFAKMDLHNITFKGRITDTIGSRAHKKFCPCSHHLLNLFLIISSFVILQLIVCCSFPVGLFYRSHSTGHVTILQINKQAQKCLLALITIQTSV